MKKVLLFLCLLVIGGCSYYKDTKVTITKEQQDNIATRILRYYDIQEVKFIQITKDSMTGSLSIDVKINNDESLRHKIRLNNENSLNKFEGYISLAPVDKYKKYERLEKFDKNEKINLSNIKIYYIGEKNE